MILSGCKLTQPCVCRMYSRGLSTHPCGEQHWDWRLRRDVGPLWLSVLKKVSDPATGGVTESDVHQCYYQSVREYCFKSSAEVDKEQPGIVSLLSQMGDGGVERGDDGVLCRSVGSVRKLKWVMWREGRTRCEVGPVSHRCQSSWTCWCSMSPFDADYLVLLSTPSAGLQTLLNICCFVSDGAELELECKALKSHMMIIKTKEDQKLSFPDFYLCGHCLHVRWGQTSWTLPE